MLSPPLSEPMVGVISGTTSNADAHVRSAGVRDIILDSTTTDRPILLS
jgi:hypothetical protein